MESFIPKISLNKVGILIPSNSNMTNVLGIPNFLIKIVLNNLQNKMNMEKLIWRNFLLGSKDLGTNVFRTLICIVGKPWSKQVV